MSGNYKLERHISAQLIEDAAIDILCHVRKEMQQQFSDTAALAGLPDGARPLWCLSWEYEDERPAIDGEATP